MTALRAVFLNAWGGQVFDALIPWVAWIGADILSLQEVTRALDPSPGWLRYGDAYRALDQRSDLLADIGAALPRHLVRFAPATRGSLSDGQGRDYASEHGIAQWIAPHLALTAQWQRFVHGAFRTGGWGPEPVPRSAQVTRVAIGTGAGLVVAHTHGLRDPAGKHDTPARAAQWQRFAAAIESVREPGDAVVAGGDLNVLPGSAVFSVLGEIGLTDLVTTRGIKDTRTTFYAKPQRFADYLFVSENVTVTRFDVPAQPEVSDHRPLILDIDLA